MKALGIEHAVYGTEDKAPAAQRILETLGLTWTQAAAMGDDWPDFGGDAARGICLRALERAC
jgi:3-deoxy-D-manno-octulosonate 8-phosphate phosphatase (KDO 8-P phosphatase)